MKAIPALRSQPTPNAMIGAAKEVTEEVEVRQADQVVKEPDMAEPVASHELDPQVIGAIRKVRKAAYPVYSFHNVRFRELVNEQAFMHEGY